MMRTGSVAMNSKGQLFELQYDPLRCMVTCPECGQLTLTEVKICQAPRSQRVIWCDACDGTPPKPAWQPPPDRMIELEP